MSAKCAPGGQALDRKAGPAELLLGPKFASGPANAGINTCSLVLKELLSGLVPVPEMTVGVDTGLIPLFAVAVAVPGPTFGQFFPPLLTKVICLHLKASFRQ